MKSCLKVRYKVAFHKTIVAPTNFIKLVRTGLPMNSPPRYNEAQNLICCLTAYAQLKSNLSYLM